MLIRQIGIAGIKLRFQITSTRMDSGRPFRRIATWTQIAIAIAFIDENEFEKQKASVKSFIISTDSPKFYARPTACRVMVTIFQSYIFAKVFSSMQYFTDSPKFQLHRQCFTLSRVHNR